MSAVQCGDGQNIHKGKDDGEECRHVPELVPVPRGGENTADGSETSELLGSFLGEEIFHLAYVAFQSLYPQRYAGRERGKETVFLTDNGQQLVGCRTCCYAYFIVGIGHHAQGVCHTVTDVCQGYLMGCIGFLALQHLFFEVVVGY